MGSNVKVLLDSDVRYGVIRWIGTPPGITAGKLMAAVELVCKNIENINGYVKPDLKYHLLF